MNIVRVILGSYWYIVVLFLLQSDTCLYSCMKMMTVKSFFIAGDRRSRTSMYSCPWHSLFCSLDTFHYCHTSRVPYLIHPASTVSSFGLCTIVHITVYRTEQAEMW